MPAAPSLPTIPLFAVVHLLIVLIAALAELPWAGLLDSFVEATDHALPPEAANVILSQIEDIQAPPRHVTEHSGRCLCLPTPVRVCS